MTIRSGSMLRGKYSRVHRTLIANGVLGEQVNSAVFSMAALSAAPFYTTRGLRTGCPGASKWIHFDAAQHEVSTWKMVIVDDLVDAGIIDSHL